jgi:hypothetical protein
MVREGVERVGCVLMSWTVGRSPCRMAGDT